MQQIEIVASDAGPIVSYFPHISKNKLTSEKGQAIG